MDHYAMWLGINATERPLQPEQLLGIAAGADPFAIEDAAHRRIEQLRPYKDGAEAATCGRLLHEIERARNRLLSSCNSQAALMLEHAVQDEASARRATALADSDARIDRNTDGGLSAPRRGRDPDDDGIVLTRNWTWLWCILSLFVGMGVTAAAVFAVALGQRSAEEEEADAVAANRAAAQVAKVKPPPLDRWKFLAQGVQDRRHFHSEAFGGKLRTAGFFELPDEGVVLIGFHYTTKPWAFGDLVDTLQPIYRTQEGERSGVARGHSELNPQQTIKAKDDYVVATIDMRVGDLIAAMNLTYARWDGQNLNMEDTYQSGWIGGKSGNPARLGGDGKLIVGIWGFTWRNEVSGLGVLSLPPGL